MINYIKMDLFRLFKSKSFYICTMVFMFLTASSIMEIRTIEKEGLENYYGEDYEEIKESVESGDTIEMGITYDSVELLVDGITLRSCISANYSGSVIILMILLLFSIFICGEYTTGYIKNTITLPKHRWYFNVSKLVTALVVFLIENLIAMGMFVFSIYCIFDKASVGDLGSLGTYLVLQMFLTLGLCAFMIMICNLFKSTTLNVVMAILVAVQVLTMPVIAILCQGLKFKYTTVSKFFMSVTTRTLPLNITGRAATETLALGIVGIIGYMILSNILITKKDI